MGQLSQTALFSYNGIVDCKAVALKNTKRGELATVILPGHNIWPDWQLLSVALVVIPRASEREPGIRGEKGLSMSQLLSRTSIKARP